MAENEWLSGYLDAVLENGAFNLDSQSISSAGRLSNAVKRGDESRLASRFFLKELLSESSLSDLHPLWQKATSVAKTEDEQGARTENLCWRIWHFAEKRAKLCIAIENRARERRRQKEEAEEDTRISSGYETSDIQTESDGNAELESHEDIQEVVEGRKTLYIVLISLHGLVRGNDMELGRDSDTGGQVKYVVEFARALASMPQVYRVDLLTRQITSPDVDWSYGEPVEMLRSSSYEQLGGGESSGAYIVRIPCGPKDSYIRKELLWPHVSEFVDGALSHILQMKDILRDEINGPDSTDPVWPYVIHGHYADAGDVAALLSGSLNVPMVMTGHSLGRNKLEQLLKQGRVSEQDINSNFKILRRIEAEEFCLDSAELVVTSTRQEVEEQWQMYDGFGVRTELKLRKRTGAGKSCHGRFMPKMAVIPPGMDFSNVLKSVPTVKSKDSFLLSEHPSSPHSPRLMEPSIWQEIFRFLANPSKPIILALARPDPKKNLLTLVKAYGECKHLRDIANLVLIMGNRSNIDDMASENAEVLTGVLKMIDKYELYGQVAYPKRHMQKEVAEIYNLAAKSKGVFVNPALMEPFGLTLIEAAAHGLPMVATKNGGPVDIQKSLGNGVLVDPYDAEAIGREILGLITNRQKWEECRSNGLKNIDIYSWPGHCRTYLQRIASCRNRHPQWKGGDLWLDDLGEGDSQTDSLRDARDVSMTLSIDAKSLGSSSLRNCADLERFLMESGRSRKEEVTGKGEGRELAAEKEDEYTGKGKGKELTAEKTRLGGSSGREGSVMEMMKCSGLVVVAIDSYDRSGEPTGHLRDILKGLIADGPEGVKIALSTALTAAESMKYLLSWGVDLSDVHLLITGSGSEVYYMVHGQLALDHDYEAHIKYRWGGEGLRQTMERLISASEEKDAAPRLGFAVEDRQRSCSRRLTYRVVDQAEAPTLLDLRKRLRMRGYRCHVIYCRAATTLQLIPLHASRAQALRYLFVRWGVSLERTVVLTSSRGDSDTEEFFGGVHRTFVMLSTPRVPQTTRYLHTLVDINSLKELRGVSIVEAENLQTEVKKALQV